MGLDEDIAALKAGVDELRNKDKDALSQIFDKVGKLADIFGALSGAGVLLEFIPKLQELFGGGPDPVTQQLQDIEKLLKVTFRFEQGEAEHTRMHLVNSTVSNIGSSVHAVLEETLPYAQASLSALNSSTLTLLDDFDHDDAQAYWQRAFFTELEYADPWFGHVVPDGIVTSRSGQQYVFDYRLTLPGYLKAISARLAALSILVSSNFVHKEEAIKELSSRAVALEGFCVRVRQGITTARIPSLNEIAYINIQDLPPPNPPMWTSGFDPVGVVTTPRPMGAVLSYDGAGKLASYPLGEYPSPLPFVGPFGPILGSPPPPPEFLNFSARYALGGAKRAKDLYMQTGLGDAWESLQTLRSLAGEATDPFDTSQFWSAREIDIDLGLADADVPSGPPGSPPPDLSLWYVVRRLADIGHLDRSAMLFVSMRDALVAATP
jgi:hypothetical protein